MVGAKWNKIVPQIAVNKLFVVGAMPKIPLFYCCGPHNRSFSSVSRLCIASGPVKNGAQQHHQ